MKVQEELLHFPRASGLMLVLEAAALTKMIKFYVKIFKTLYFLNPQMDLVYIWYDYRCWSKTLLSFIYTPAYDLEVKVTDLEILCSSFASIFLRSNRQVQVQATVLSSDRPCFFFNRKVVIFSMDIFPCKHMLCAHIYLIPPIFWNCVLYYNCVCLVYFRLLKISFSVL